MPYRGVALAGCAKPPTANKLPSAAANKLRRTIFPKSIRGSFFGSPPSPCCQQVKHGCGVEVAGSLTAFQRFGSRIQNSIEKRGRFSGRKRLGELDCFVDYHLQGRSTRAQFVDGQPEDAAVDLGHAV